MDFSFDIPDSTDWLDTPLARVAPLESALRCQVCKDFFDNPVITSCSHTFCSLCIRRCLSSEGKCPTCRSTDQEVRLRRNWAVQELVDTFKEARADILALARAHKPVDKSGDAQQSHGRDDAAGEPAAKRRRVDDTSDQVASFSVQSEPPATAPQSRAPDSSVPPALEAVESGSPGHVGSSDVHQASPSRASPSVNSSTEPSDDIVACPICNRKMKNEAVFGHLDSCPGPSRSPTENSTPTPTPTPVSLNRGRPPKYSQRTPFGPRQSVSSDNNNSKPPERLPALNYALLKDNALRKKLRELGIPHWGPRQLLQRRHTEWMNLWNANCDARVPKSHAELLRDLDTWERTQGGLAANSGGSAASGGSSIMAKDFDAKAWSASHGNAFKDLIAKARQGKVSMKGSSTETTKVETTQTTMSSAPTQTATQPPMQTTTPSAPMQAASPSPGQTASPPVSTQTTMPPALIQTTSSSPSIQTSATPTPGQMAATPAPIHMTMPPAPTQSVTPAPTQTATPPWPTPSIPPAPMCTTMPPGPMHTGMQPPPTYTTIPPAPISMPRSSGPMQPTPTAAPILAPAPAPIQTPAPVETTETTARTNNDLAPTMAPTKAPEPGPISNERSPSQDAR